MGKHVQIRSFTSLFFPLIPLVLFFTACSTSRSVSKENYSKSSLSIGEVVNRIPDYSESLNTLEGKGRALVSEPGNSDRVTIEFQADTALSLLTIQNRIGIEGGKMLVDQDSILIYNRLDDYAQKLSIYDGRMTSLNELASINILDLINFKVGKEQVQAVFENNNFLQLRLKNGARVYLSKEGGQVRQVEQPPRSAAPYSRLEYESYGELNGFILPRKITIFSSDGDSRVVFLIRSLDVNPKLPELTIDIPKNVEIERL
ncbi:DUF4292 domain-containing protein [Gracilimonas mengyeensis]|uniref:DUF4292 domain-containing protein n=1 Tax=Gracilimonas mengyeensis TaxID=1302730 RepID=A0A521CD33_9BACT|nr:DUF4292 domain-containing protein [Gracilimonas mengyeensis]SMO57323.1 protein of unknown function [Gracilimonas mengyeensis]